MPASPNFPLDKFGLGVKLHGDLYGGYQTDLFYLDSSDNYLVANPVLYLEAALRSQVDFFTPFFSYSLRFKFEGFRYNPFDFTFLWSLNSLD